MSKVNVYNLKGEQAGEAKLNPDVFALEEIRADIVHQAVDAQRSRQRNTVAATKTRSEVRGGGRKPWRQKGTGRARAGSIRSPLWVGGGVTFGPSAERNFEKGINVKTKRLAVRMALTDKLNEQRLFVVDKFDISSGKTREALEMFKVLRKKLKLPEGKQLLITEKKHDHLIRATGNLPDVSVKMANSFNIMNILKAGSVLIEKGALNIIEKTYGNTASTENVSHYRTR